MFSKIFSHFFFLFFYYLSSLSFSPTLSFLFSPFSLLSFLSSLSLSLSLCIAGKGRLRLERDRLEGALKRTREQFSKGLDVLLIRIGAYKEKIDIRHVWEMEKSISDVNEEITESNRRILLFNAEESILGLAVTHFHTMEEIKTSLAPFAKLWGLAALSSKSVQEWTETPC